MDNDTATPGPLARLATERDAARSALAAARDQLRVTDRHLDHLRRQAEVDTAALARLKAERDEARGAARRAIAYGGRLESEAARYRAALERIATEGGGGVPPTLREIARTALETTTKETTT